MATVTEEFLNNPSKIDLVAFALNLQDKMYTVKRNLNDQCPVFKMGMSWNYRHSLSDKDLEEVVCKAITKSGVDINADEIEDCHRVRNIGKTIIGLGKRKVSRQVLSAR